MYKHQLYVCGFSYYFHSRIIYTYRNNSTHAQQPPSYQSSAEQQQTTNANRINSSETVEYALSKGTATEINNGTIKHNCHCKSADSHTEMSSDLCKDIRDRLGLWGTRSDAEVAGQVNGFDRLRYGRFNKVRIFYFTRFLATTNEEIQWGKKTKEVTGFISISVAFLRVFLFVCSN